jgi:transcriptional regulator with XRE-family HTH domain
MVEISSRIMDLRMTHDGQLLEDLIKELGFKKGQLADKLHVNANTITNYLHRQTIKNDVLIEIGQAMRYDLSTKFPRLKKIPEATVLNYFNTDPEKLLTRVEEINDKYDHLVKAIADKDQKIDFLQDRIQSMQQIVDAKNEIIDGLKDKLRSNDLL